jgi:hypothetical protein
VLCHRGPELEPEPSCSRHQLCGLCALNRHLAWHLSKQLCSSDLMRHHHAHRHRCMTARNLLVFFCVQATRISQRGHGAQPHTSVGDETAACLFARYWCGQRYRSGHLPPRGADESGKREGGACGGQGCGQPGLGGFWPLCSSWRATKRRRKKLVRWLIPGFVSLSVADISACLRCAVAGHGCASLP